MNNFEALKNLWKTNYGTLCLLKSKTNLSRNVEINPEPSLHLSKKNPSYS